MMGKPMNKCNVCENYLVGLSEPRCKFCHFEWAEELVKDEWDILNEDDAWGYEYAIRDRLWSKDIECLSADIWGSNNMAIVYGCCDEHRLAMALNVHSECIYTDPLHDVAIINLYQEKHLRGECGCGD